MNSIPVREGPFAVGSPKLRAFVLCGLVIFLALGVFAPGRALAAEPPTLRQELVNEEVFPTRLFVQFQFAANASSAIWSCEYATSLSGPWTPAGGGKTEQFLGECGEDSRAGTMIHHLSTSTQYFVRIRVENEAGQAERTYTLETLPASPPEITTVVPAGGSTFVGPDTESIAKPHSARFRAEVAANGAPAEYRFEFTADPENPGSWQTFASGTVSVAEDVSVPNPVLSGLAAETTYYVRIRLSNEKGSREVTSWLLSGALETSHFKTATAKPLVNLEPVRNVSATSAFALGFIRPHGSETSWSFETATSESGPWTRTPGSTGVISQSEAEAMLAAEEEESEQPALARAFARLVGLDPGTSYWIRLFAENEAGEGEGCILHGENLECLLVSGPPSFPFSIAFTTGGAPVAHTLSVHGLEGEAVRLIGSVNPSSQPTDEEQTIAVEGQPRGGSFVLSFAGEGTQPLTYDAPSTGPQSVSHALNALPAIADHGSVHVEGPDGGPYMLWFGGERNELAGEDQPPVGCDGAELEPASAFCSVETTQQGGESFPARAHFEYEGQRQLEEEGGEPFDHAASTPDMEIGSGVRTRFPAVALPEAIPGETYRYRLVATNDSPGSPVVDGGESTLTVPTPPSVEQASCPNEAERVGPSTHLSDCRAYEQLTPADKEGAQEIFNYGAALEDGFLAGEGGESAVLKAPAVSWGTKAADGQGPYFFTRSGAGWEVTPGTPQPASGVSLLTPELFAPDLNRTALRSEMITSPAAASEEIQFLTGPPGGPYALAASPLRTNTTSAADGWVGSSGDFSTLVLRTEDHKLLGTSTGTRSGGDLYDYAAGQLRQLNVTGAGAGAKTIGRCGARLASGEGEEVGSNSSPHAVSADGSRIFFVADPGSECSEAPDLYLRIDGDTEAGQTVSIGGYRFLAANDEGTEALLEGTGGTGEVYLYHSATGVEPSPILTLGEGVNSGNLAASGDLSTVYLMTPKRLTPDAPEPAALPEGEVSHSVVGDTVGFDLYRFDLSSQRLSFLAQVAPANLGGGLGSITRDGRFAYFEAEAVSGMSAGAAYEGHQSFQLFRYDNEAESILCISCVSSFDPAPRLSARLGDISGDEGRLKTANARPKLQLVSNDGRFAFFDTPAALVPSDVDGEVPPGVVGATSYKSQSTDVYEWRDAGVADCAQVRGCLSLLTDGRGGFHNLLLGSAHEGRDVFIYTNSRLGPRDTDTAGDIYDVRIDGGEPPAPLAPVECEGDSCHSPPPSPLEPTLSTSVPGGRGNVFPAQPRSHRHKHHRHKSKGRHSAATKNGGRK